MSWSIAEQPKLFKVEETYQSDQHRADKDVVPMVGVGGQKNLSFDCYHSRVKRYYI